MNSELRPKIFFPRLWRTRDDDVGSKFDNVEMRSFRGREARGYVFHGFGRGDEVGSAVVEGEELFVFC